MFGAYLADTKNTICGRHPLQVRLNYFHPSLSLLTLLAAQIVLHALRGYGRETTTRFVHYAQSSRCESMGDSSVSYAAGYTALEEEDEADGGHGTAM